MSKQDFPPSLFRFLTLSLSLFWWGCIGDPNGITYSGEPSVGLNVTDDIDDASDIDNARDGDGKNRERADDGAACSEDKDCKSDHCVDLICLPTTCLDEVKSEQETDVDCGGPHCAPCADGRRCDENSDCQSSVCSSRTCQPPSCEDGVKNGTETDVDCGGDCPRKCAYRQRCESDSDCETQSCLQGLCTFCDPTSPVFGAGDGNLDNPYLICTPEHLDNIRRNLNSHFRLEADLDMSSLPNFQPIGTLDLPFTGSLNGNSFKITNLNIDRPDHHYQGLFGLIDTPAELSNIKLVDVNITGKNYVGGLLGRNFAGKIINSSVTGEVHGKDYVGGLTGENSYPRGDGREREPGIIQSSYAAGEATGERRVGGLVGRNLRSEVQNSYAISEVSGTNYVGGLIGENSETNALIQTSYALSKVSGTEDFGGLVGQNWGGEEVQNSYQDSDACSPEQCTNSIGDPLTGAEFRSQESFPGWDFSNIWTMSDERPILRWEQD